MHTKARFVVLALVTCALVGACDATAVNIGNGAVTGVQVGTDSSQAVIDGVLLGVDSGLNQ